ncbi:MAG: TolC family protein [Cyclobacteriaceae bacterium]|nr:TolC family protein [Cyclobacteriaceae bacterium]
MIRTITLVVIFSLATVTASHAQEPKSWTLKECIDVALENNLRIKRSFYNVETFKANLLQSKAGFLPTLNAGGSYNQNYGRALNPVTNLFVNRDNNTINVQGIASWNLFNGLRVQNSFRAGQRDVVAAEKDLEKAKNDLILNVVTLYTNVIFNQELFHNARLQLSSSQQQLERIQKQVAAGSLPLASQLNQEAQVATNEVNLINQENTLNLSLLQLKQAMQIPGNTPMQVVVPEIEAEDLVLSQTAEDIYQLSLGIMPEILSARLKLESAEYGLKAARGNYYPRLNLNASAQSNYASVSDVPRSQLDGTFSLSNNPFGEVQGTGQQVFGYVPNTIQVAEGYGRREQLEDNLFKSVGVQLNIPILNGLATRANVQRSKINKSLAEVAIQENENALRQSIETAYNDAVAASKSYTSSLKQVKAQEEAYRINKQRYEIGAINFVEYQVSENDLFRSRSDLTRAKYSFIFRKKVLDFYQGKPIEF